MQEGADACLHEARHMAVRAALAFLTKLYTTACVMGRLRPQNLSACILHTSSKGCCHAGEGAVNNRVGGQGAEGRGRGSGVGRARRERGASAAAGSGQHGLHLKGAARLFRQHDHRPFVALTPCFTQTCWQYTYEIATYNQGPGSGLLCEPRPGLHVGHAMQ